MNKKKLKIGLLIDSYMIPKWMYDMIESVLHSNHSEIALIIRKEDTSTSNTSLWKKRNESLFLLYSRWDKRMFKPNPDAFQRKNLREIIDCREITVTPQIIESKDCIITKDIDSITTFKIDVLIKLGFNDLKGNIFSCATYGIWAYHHGDFEIRRGNVFGFWEVFDKCDETKATLLQLAEDKEDSLKIYEAYFSTDHVSVSRNRNILFSNSCYMLPRKLQELYDVGDNKFFLKLKKEKNKPLFYYNKIYNVPTNRQFIKGFYRNWKQAVKGMIQRKLFMPQWILLFKLESSEKIAKSFNDFIRIMPPKESFWADPFVIEKNDRFYIFIEEFVFTENKGKISVIEMDQNGNYSHPTVVLETSYHLSYPFLIEEGNELYMIPETEANRTIELYRCIDFPTKWELKEVIMDDIMAVDTTIYKQDDTYWLFSNMKDFKGTKMVNELMLFSSNSLLKGDWTPHPQNPIAIDHRHSRPAGSIFKSEGRIFRPAQNCSKHYGYGMQIMEIITLTKSDYKEQLIQSIYPNWEKDVESVHTLNASGRLTLIDAMINRRK